MDSKYSPFMMCRDGIESAEDPAPHSEKFVGTRLAIDDASASDLVVASLSRLK